MLPPGFLYGSEIIGKNACATHMVQRAECLLQAAHDMLEDRHVKARKDTGEKACGAKSPILWDVPVIWQVQEAAKALALGFVCGNCKADLADYNSHFATVGQGR